MRRHNLKCVGLLVRALLRKGSHQSVVWDLVGSGPGGEGGGGVSHFQGVKNMLGGGAVIGVH